MAIPRPFPCPGCCARSASATGAVSGPPLRHVLAIRGSPRAVTTCRKQRRCRSDLLDRSGAEARHRTGVLHPAVLLARLSLRGDLRLLAHLEDAEGSRRADGPAPCRRPVLLLHARCDPRRAAGLCAVLYRGGNRHPFGLHRFLGRGPYNVEAAAPVGRGDELPRRPDRRDRGDGLGVMAGQTQFHPRGRLRQRRGADGDAAGAAGELYQRRALWPRHRCALGDGVPERSCRTAAPSQPALPGRARRACDAGHHDGSVLVHPRPLSPGSAGGGVHPRHGNCPLRQRIFPRAGSTTG